jgi:hydrogenase nickel incorporation protein HypA/HybF
MVDIAAETAMNNGGGKVTAVYLALGPHAGVVKDALIFSWKMACADTLLEGSRLVIEDVPLVVRCSECDAERELESVNNLICSVCHEPTPAVVHGREFQITALEID